MDNWYYEGQDPSIRLFDECLKAWSMPVAGKVAELGSCETDFLERMADLRFDITGIDQRFRDYRGLPTARQIKGDILDPSFHLPYFDWLISLGTVEHIGLGFYGDLEDEDGDRKALERFVRAGVSHMYFDVPWTPYEHHVVPNRHFRVYDDRTLRERLIPAGFELRGLLYSLAEPITVVPRPSTSPAPLPYYYAALWIERTR